MPSYASIIMIALMIVVFYFLIMRPQRKRQQQQQQMMKAIEPGARVVTTTGIYATVVAVGETQIVLETHPGTRVTMMKQAVSRVINEGDEDESLAAHRHPVDLSGVESGGQGADQRTGDHADQTNAQSGNQTGNQTGNQSDADENDQTGTASGMAGGAPIREYAPGSAPDFTAPDDDADQDHETAPWPPYGAAESSVLGESSLGGDREQQTNKTDQ